MRYLTAAESVASVSVTVDVKFLAGDIDFTTVGSFVSTDIAEVIKGPSSVPVLYLELLLFISFSDS